MSKLIIEYYGDVSLHFVNATVQSLHVELDESSTLEVMKQPDLIGTFDNAHKNLITPC